MVGSETGSWQALNESQPHKIMDISIIGAGNVGGTLGTRWARKGHRITFGVRTPRDPKIKKVLEAAGPNATADNVPDAAASAEVVVFTTPWDATQSAVQSAGNLADKIVIDATNPILLGAEELRKGLVVGHTTSAAEQVASWAKAARVVKAFNTTGFGNMADPKYGNQNASMFICGDDLQAKETVKKLSDELGFDTIDAGPLSTARYLEPTAMLWIHLAFACGLGPNFAFKVLKR
jgi:NADPH-dependent F420 reductase